MSFAGTTPCGMFTIAMTTSSVLGRALPRFAQRSTVRNFMLRLESADVLASQVTLD